MFRHDCCNFMRKQSAMIKNLPYLFLFVLFIVSCATPKYFHDQSSYERQKKLRANRSGNVLVEIAKGIGSIVMADITDSSVEFYPSDQEFKKLKLLNPTMDTMYVNMLTDLVWDKEDYCDFMDIRIPPQSECKVVVPTRALYNLYFSITPQSDDDELLEIYTSDIKKISLTPGITKLNDSIQ